MAFANREFTVKVEKDYNTKAELEVSHNAITNYQVGATTTFPKINPLLRISDAISDYLKRKKSYTLIVDTDDELQELNENVKELVEINKKLSKHS